MGNIDVIVNVLFGIYEILQAFFSGDLTLLRALFSRLSLFNFQGPFASRSRGQLIQYITSLSLCQEVFQNFFEFFILSFLLQALLSACRLFDSLSIISLRAPFVKRFFLTFSSFYSLFLSLYTLSRYRSLKRAFILSLSFPFVNSFLSFFTYFPPTSLFCTLFDTLYSVFCTPAVLRRFLTFYFCFTYICPALYLRYYILLSASICVIFSTPTPEPVGRPDFSRFTQTRCRRVEQGKEEISEKSAFLPNTRYRSSCS